MRSILALAMPSKSFIVPLKCISLARSSCLGGAALSLARSRDNLMRKRLSFSAVCLALRETRSSWPASFFSYATNKTTPFKKKQATAHNVMTAFA
jgi:hypothetical protein